MKNQLQSVNLIAPFDNGLCLEIRNIYVEDTNNRRPRISKCISTKDNFSFIKEFNPLVKSEVSSLADKESCLSIAFDELKKTSNLSYILSSI